MKALRHLKLYGMIAAIVASISIPVNFAHSVDCLTTLTQAEKRWNKLRYQTVMTPAYERKVTRHLTMAAELRHQGMTEGCLRQVVRAIKEMDLEAGGR